MLKKLKLVSIVLSGILGLSGCSTIWDPVHIPNYSPTVKVFLSDDHVSTFTEMPAEDHLVDNSQVFLAGKGGASSFLGLLGVIVDQTRNSPDIDTSSETLGVKFHSILDEIIKKENLTSPKNWQFDILKNSEFSEMIFLPSVRLEVGNDKLAQATYRLTVRFLDLHTNKMDTKDYYYFDEKRIPISGSDGWAYSNAKKLKMHGYVAFRALINVLKKDMSGQYKTILIKSSNTQVNINFPGSENSVKAVLLEENDTRVLVSYLFKEKIIRASMVMVPKDIVEIQ